MSDEKKEIYAGLELSSPEPTHAHEDGKVYAFCARRVRSLHYRFLYVPDSERCPVCSRAVKSREPRPPWP